jgi:AraC family transcriptional regulator
MARTNSPAGYVRSVGGDLVSSVITRSSAMRVELLRRVSRPKIHWHFRQPELSLFWFRTGPSSLRARVNGRPVEHHFARGSNLAIIPPGTEIEGEWSVQPRFEYAVVFLDSPFVMDRLKAQIEQPMLACRHERLTSGLAELCDEAAAPDNVFELFAEGWATLALAHMVRVCRTSEPAHAPMQGGLSARALRRVDDYIRANLAEKILLSDLCSLADLSQRHFLRAFGQSAGTTPHKYILRLRIEESKRRLRETDESMTEVALAAGFSHSQHFATSFRNAVGLSPTSYRGCIRA